MFIYFTSLHFTLLHFDAPRLVQPLSLRQGRSEELSHPYTLPGAQTVLTPVESRRNIDSDSDSDSELDADLNWT